MHFRISETQKQFIDLCQSFGAELIEEGPVTSRVEILAQANYTPESIGRINSLIKSTKTFWLSGLAMGNASYKFLHGKRIDKLLVPDKQLYLFRIKNYSDDGINFDDDFIQEIGMPYVRYPLFSPLPDIDYIIANPTPFSFVSLQDRLEYLDRLITVVKVLTNRGDRIAYKPHNADERHDYIVKQICCAVTQLSFFWLACEGVHAVFTPFDSLWSPINSKASHRNMHRTAI